MAKDAKGHGSEKHGGGVAISGGKLITGINKPVRGSSTGVAISGGKLITGINKPGDPRDNIAAQNQWMGRKLVAADLGLPQLSDKQAAAVLAQGNPKSAPVDVHPSAAGVQMNPISAYTEAGTKASRASRQGDAAGARFHSDWARRAIGLEKGDNATKARAAFDEAYKVAGARKFEPFR